VSELLKISSELSEFLDIPDYLLNMINKCEIELNIENKESIHKLIINIINRVEIKYGYLISGVNSYHNKIYVLSDDMSDFLKIILKNTKETKLVSYRRLSI